MYIYILESSLLSGCVSWSRPRSMLILMLVQRNCDIHIYTYCCRPAAVPTVVSAGVVLESAAVARPRRPDICQPESGVPPEGSASGPIEWKQARGPSDPHRAPARHRRGETPQGGNSPRGNPPANTYMYSQAGSKAFGLIARVDPIANASLACWD